MTIGTCEPQPNQVLRAEEVSAALFTRQGDRWWGEAGVGELLTASIAGGLMAHTYAEDGGTRTSRLCS